MFATSTRDHPIHLWDATSGQVPSSCYDYLHVCVCSLSEFVCMTFQYALFCMFLAECQVFFKFEFQLRCTYRAYDAVDEITAAFSIGFNPGGNK